MKGALILLGVLVVALLIFGSQLLDLRSEIKAEKNEIDARWEQVDSDMKERADSVLALLASIRRPAKEPEQPVITEVQNARLALLNARRKHEEMDANARLDDAIPRLLLAHNRETSVTLQDELAREENQIAVDRRDYNAAITKYNTDIELFPKNVAAGIFGLHRDDGYFKTPEKEKNAPRVKF